MKLTVIIPTLNAGRFLPNLLERLSSQTVSDKEIIVIDSASDDETVEVARSFGATVKPIVRREFNHGRTRNVAADDASGEYLVFLTQDALPVDGRLLENLIAPLENATLSVVDMGEMLFCSVILLPFMRTGWKLSRPEGIFLLLTYIAYTAWLIIAG